MGVLLDFIYYLLYGHPEQDEQDEADAYEAIYGEREPELLRRNRRYAPDEPRESERIVSVHPIGEDADEDAVLTVKPYERPRTERRPVGPLGRMEVKRPESTMEDAGV